MRSTGNRTGGSNPSLSAISSANLLKCLYFLQFVLVTLKLAYNPPDAGLGRLDD
jgi:hypothetical protein